jgi:predicted nuclease with RNAse H fold
VLTAGIDLAAEPKGTALSLIDWREGKASLISVEVGVTDNQIISAIREAHKIGIDCALGWPLEFIDFLNRQADSHSGEIDGGLDWRRQVSFRETDRHVRQVTGRWPLSVATDRLGMTALRCAGLLSKFRLAGLDTDRSGMGPIVEVYPAAALRIWGFEIAGYRNSSSIRDELLRELSQSAPQLELGTFREALVESCDAFDSLIAALNTRSAALGFYEVPSGDTLKNARREGWIALPNRPLGELFAQ